MGEQERETVTVAEAAKILGISRNLAYLLIRQSRLPAIRLGHRLVVPRVQLKAILAGNLGAAARNAGG